MVPELHTFLGDVDRVSLVTLTGISQYQPYEIAARAAGQGSPSSTTSLTTEYTCPRVQGHSYHVLMHWWNSPGIIAFVPCSKWFVALKPYDWLALGSRSYPAHDRSSGMLTIHDILMAFEETTKLEALPTRMPPIEFVRQSKRVVKRSREWYTDWERRQRLEQREQKSDGRKIGLPAPRPLDLFSQLQPHRRLLAYQRHRTPLELLQK